MARKVKTPRRPPKVRAMLEDLAFMGRSGVTTELAAERLGVSVDTLRKRIDRHKAFPLWSALVDNERRRFGGLTAAEVRALPRAGYRRRAA